MSPYVRSLDVTLHKRNVRIGKDGCLHIDDPDLLALWDKRQKCGGFYIAIQYHWFKQVHGPCDSTDDLGAAPTESRVTPPTTKGGGPPPPAVTDCG